MAGGRIAQVEPGLCMRSYDSLTKADTHELRYELLLRLAVSHPHPHSPFVTAARDGIDLWGTPLLRARRGRRLRPAGDAGPGCGYRRRTMDKNDPRGVSVA